MKISSKSPVEIRVFSTPREVSEDDLRGCVAVVIDVLRSSSTIATACMNGAREIVPVATPAEAGELASKSGRGGALLCGEREGKPIEGFDLGNSPLEYTAEKVSGRNIFFASTNGAPTVVRVRNADRIYVGGFNNFSAVMGLLTAEDRRIALVCSGQNDKLSIEDFVCAGRFVEALDLKFGEKVVVNDGARAATLLYQQFRGQIGELLRCSTHGKYLTSLGFSADLEYCARVDSVPVVPMFIEGKIRGFKPDGNPVNETASLTA
jgi:2-phosphosulfolactate phosphatase